MSVVGSFAPECLGVIILNRPLSPSAIRSVPTGSSNFEHEDFAQCFEPALIRRAKGIVKAQKKGSPYGEPFSKKINKSDNDHAASAPL